MTKSIVTLSLLLAIIGLSANASELDQQIKIEVVSTEEMREILKQNPNAVPLERKVHVEPTSQNAKGQELSSPDVVVQYYLGTRVVGDNLVAHDQQNRSWSSPRNVQLTLTYPANGTNGRVLTYVNIIVTQSNYGGQAVVVSGGIGYRYIRIVVEAYNTYVFNHNANFYGK